MAWGPAEQLAAASSAYLRFVLRRPLRTATKRGRLRLQLLLDRLAARGDLEWLLRFLGDEGAAEIESAGPSLGFEEGLVLLLQEASIASRKRRTSPFAGSTTCCWSRPDRCTKTL